MKPYCLLFLFLSGLLLLDGRRCIASEAFGRDSLPAEVLRLTSSDTLSAADPEALRLAALDQALEKLAGRDSTFAREVDVTAGRLPLTELLRQYRSGQRSESFGAERREHSGVVQLHPGPGGRSDTFPLPGIPPRCHGHRKHRIHLPAAVLPVPQPDPDIAYDALDTTLRYDLRGERLIDVAKKIGPAHGAQYHSSRTALRL